MKLKLNENKQYVNKNMIALKFYFRIRREAIFY